MSPAATMPHATSPESLHRQSSLQGRWRPSPDALDIPTRDAPTEPSRAEKLGRRESRLGLRSIFARTKTVKHTDSSTPPRLPKPPGRDNATEGIPYYTLPPGKPIVRSQISRPLSTSVEDAESPQEAPLPLADTPRRKTANAHTKPARGGGPSWNAPPLHKAYPQAVRYSTLSAATVPADLILRAYAKKTGESASPSDSTAAQGDDKAKSRRKHRRTKSGADSDLEWTTKTYILVTSGYLLEYSSEGPFDRLPEKVLRLGRSSAAFASDLIPGRHWVLQVASATGSDAGAGADSSKSFFSRFPFRGGAEKRSTSNMLLVFDNADTMDEWLATLRRAIEALGGKQSLSETGKPKGENVVPLREQPSQRTLVVKDSDRYSRSIPENQPWEPEFVRRESDASFVPSETAARGQSIDDMSTTNSVISHDGQQLDSLRNSANRLSCVSSGQRTMVTSAGSSPACSPTADTFPTSLEEPPRRKMDPNSAESRLRPNASAIVDRRKSLQTLNPFVELQPNPAPQRPHSTFISPVAPAQDSGAPAGNSLSPNFSVPHSSNRRFSTARTSTAESSMPSTPPRDPEAPSRTMSRKPPTTLNISRPLSMVVDQPSPRENMPERPATRHGETSRSADPELVPLPPSRPESRVQDGRSTPSLGLQSPPKYMGAHNSPRRLSSMGALRQRGDASPGEVTGSSEEPPPRMRALHPPQTRAQDPDRCYSSIDACERGNTLSPSRVTKRASMLPFVPDRGAPNSMIHEPPTAPPPSIPLPPVPTSSKNRLKPDANVHALLNRRSMPHLVEGPPPAPPPTCALPPIPKNAQKKDQT